MMAKKHAAGNFLARFGNRKLLRTSIVFSLVLTTLSLSPFEPAAHAAVAETDSHLSINDDATWDGLIANGGVIPSAADFTIEAWVNPTSLNNSSIWHSIFQQSGGNQINYGRFDLNLITAANNSTNGYAGVQIIYDGINLNTTTDQPSVRIYEGRWSHLAVSVDYTSSTSTIRLYLNGVEVASKTETPSYRVIRADGFTVGYFPFTGTDRHFHGGVDQLKVWNGLLTSSQLKQSMHAYGSTGVTSAPTLRSQLTFNSGYTDSTGNYTYSTTGTPTRSELAQTTVSGTQTTVTFPRSYITSTGGWQTPDSVTAVRALVIAGGGGGGSDEGGGGGAGGFLESASTPVSGVNQVVVGAGGSGGLSTDTAVIPRRATNGTNSIFGPSSNLLTAIGGGAGGDATNTSLNGVHVANGLDGGSGGGEAGESYSATAGSGTTGQGFAGATGAGLGSGGGGAGAAATGRAGGIGKSSSITGSAVTYAAGGSGGAGNTASQTTQAATDGIGGAGGNSSGGATNGSNNTGSGGGGGNVSPADITNAVTGADGGSGVVIISYRSSFSISYAAGYGGTGSQTSGTTTVGLANNFTTPLPTFTSGRTGYTFAGWSDGTNIYAANATYPANGNVASDVTLTATWAAPTQTVDYALNFTGASPQFASTTAQILPATDAYTVEAWIKPASDTPSNAVIFSQGTTSTTRMYVKRDGSGNIIVVRDRSAENRCGIAAANVWSHIALTYNGNGQSRCYLNGVQLSEFTTVSASTASLTAKFVVGDYSYATGTALNTWKGSIDEVRVYSTAREGADILTDLKTYGPVNASSLIAYYDFNEGTGTSANNQSATAATGTNLTFTGTPGWANIATSSSNGNRNIVTFPRSYLNNSGGWTSPASVTKVDALVVGGGGGGASINSGAPVDGGGGGGGGGAYLATDLPVSGITSVIVGHGGTGGLYGSTSYGREGNRGGTTNFGSLTAGGGGGGGCSIITSNGVICAAGAQQHGSSGTAGGGGGGSSNYMNAYNWGAGGTGAALTVGSTTYPAQNGFAGSYFNDRVPSASGNAGPGGGSRSLATRTVSSTLPGSGLVSDISGSDVEYGRGGGAFGVTGWTFSQTTSGIGTGGDGVRLASAVETNGATGANGIVVLSYRTSYSITYAAGTGGSGTQTGATTSVGLSNNFTTPENTFTHAGYTFAGWNDGTSTYAAGATYPTNGNVTDDVVLTAQWTANTNTVTYESNGGSSVANGSFTTGGSIASAPTPPTKTGYTFAHWSDTDGGTAVTFPYSPSATSGITLYASWTANSNTVTFNSNYGTATTSTQSITSGASTALTANSFSRSGYTFSGWNTVADGSGTSYTNSQSITIYAPVTLYAQWSVVTYTVTYNVNGATGSAEKATDTYRSTTGALSLATKGTMENVGYKFDGWYDNASGGSLVGLASASYTPTANITLYARWTAEAYRINYDSNGGGNNPAYDTYTTGTSPVQLKTQGSLSRSGYTFNGWSTTINDVATKIANSETSATLTATAPVQLYALWTADDYQVFYSAGQDATSGSAPSDSLQYNIGQSATIKGSGTLVRTGYTFGGWTDSSSTYQSGSTYTFGAASVTLTPVWDPITYNISYNTNGATAGSRSSGSNTYTTGDPAMYLAGDGTLARTGYDFAGWSPSPTQTNAPLYETNDTFTTTSDVTLYAIWTLKRIAYSYDRGTIDSTTLSNLEVGTFPAAPSSPYPLYGSNLTLSSTISPTITVNGSSYKFFGWYDDQATYAPGSTFLMPDVLNLKFTAQWAKLYAVRYVLNGGTGIAAADDECNEPGNACVVNEPITLSGTPTRDGYTFDGWLDQSNVLHPATTVNTPSTMSVNSSNYLLYAQWTPIEYDISFNASGGSVSPGIQNKFIGDSVTLPSPGTRTGYDFDGWTLGGITYGVGTTFTVGASDAVFTALWTAKRYNISFDWNSGVGTSTQSPIFTYGDQPIVLPSGTRDGYVFDGWSTSLNGSAISSPHTPTSDTTYYARWVDGQYTITYNAVGGTVARTSDSVARASAITLPSATRTGYTFDGWYTDSATTLSYGQANASIIPGQSQTLYAKWTQNSLAGINPAHLNALGSVTVQTASEGAISATHTTSGTGAQVIVPADALPPGTEVKLSFVEDLTRPKNIIDNRFAYYASVVLHWQLGTGANATVPTAAAGKPLVLTLSNPDIRSGAKIYSIIQGVATEVATATQDGEVDIEIYDDPEIVVAAVTPTAPLSVSATGNQNAQSTVSWNAPQSSGGAVISGYTVTSSPGGQTCTTMGETTCTVTGLTNNTSYTFSVVATNAVGNSTLSASSNAATPRLLPTFNAVFNSKGGSTVSDSLFTQPGTLSEPTAPTRTGYIFGGWLTTDGNAASIVTFPYSPGVQSDIMLYAYWVAVVDTPAQTPVNAPAKNPAVNSESTSSVGTSSNNPLVNTPEIDAPVDAPETYFDVFKNAPYPSNGLNIPTLGETIVLLNREPVVATVTTRETDTLIEFGNNLSVIIKSHDLDGAVVPVTDGVVKVVQGANILATGNGFKSISPVEAWLYSSPIRLGDGVTDADGNFQSTFDMPVDVPLGKHTVVLNGVTASGEVATLALGVQVINHAAPTQAPIPNTASDTWNSSALVSVILAIAALALFANRRRKRGAHS